MPPQLEWPCAGDAMRALNLDFRNDHPWRTRSGWVALLVAGAVFGLMAWHQRAVSDATAIQQARLDALTERLYPGERARRDPHAPRLGNEVRAAREILVRLDLPWGRLFGAVEAANDQDIALLGIDPNPNKGTVLITGEAKGYDEVLDYTRRLETSGSLTGVYLQHHKVELQDPQQPVHFTVGAAWVSGS